MVTSVDDTLRIRPAFLGCTNGSPENPLPSSTSVTEAARSAKETVLEVSYISYQNG